jgi:hypothetical protein
MRARRRAGEPWAATLGPWLMLSWVGLLSEPPFQPRFEPEARSADSVAATWCDDRAPEAVPLEEASPRQLRALPGIGRGRARALIEAGQRRGAALELADWSALPGLGGRTLDEVRRALEARGP